MKILHTSDWHLGHILYNYDRTEEQTSMLEQMVTIVKEEKPDVFLLSGDVYHTPQPSAAVQTLYTDYIVKIHDANPEMVMVVTAGNHDSGSRHEIFRMPWHALKVYAVGTVNKGQPEEHVIEIPGKGFILAVPYCNERNMPKEFFQNLINCANVRNKDGLPIVMAAHTTVKGCDYTGNENASEYSVGGIDSYDIGEMGEGYDYLALGHIHHAQFVHGGSHHIRYCGSPLAVSFDETFSHSVSIVEIEKHGDVPTVKTVDIVNPHPLVTLPTKDWANWEQAKQLLKDYPEDIPAYIRLNVEFDDYLPAEANAEADNLAESKQCRFCFINTKRKQQDKGDVQALTVQEFQQKKPLDIARQYAGDTDVNFDEEMESLFTETLRMLDEESREDKNKKS